MSVSEPGKIITPWAESGLKNTIPPAANPATGRAGFDQGFSAINMTAKEAGGIPPFGQDFNGIFYEVTNILRYMQAGGQPTFDSALATAIGGYPKGAMVLGNDGTSVYKNIVDSNSSNPNSGGSGWAREDLILRETLRRSYAEAGYNLVSGSFEAGGVLTSASDVLLREASGKAYSGAGPFPQNVGAGTSPSAGGFTDRSPAAIRVQLALFDGGSISGFGRGGAFPLSNIYQKLLKIYELSEFGKVTETVQDLQGVVGSGAHDKLVLDGYFAGYRVGGGTFIWRGDLPKTKHDGGLFIDPGKTFPSKWASGAAAWFDSTGSTGNGVWQRVYDGEYILAEWFGAVPWVIGGTQDSTLSFRQCATVAGEGGSWRWTGRHRITSWVEIPQQQTFGSFGACKSVASALFDRANYQGPNTSTGANADKISSAVFFDATSGQAFRCHEGAAPENFTIYGNSIIARGVNIGAALPTDVNPVSAFQHRKFISPKNVVVALFAWAFDSSSWYSPDAGQGDYYTKITDCEAIYCKYAFRTAGAVSYNKKVFGMRCYVNALMDNSNASRNTVFYGGSVEGYNLSTECRASGSISFVGTYFETFDPAFNGAVFNLVGGGMLSFKNCLIYLNHTAQFVYSGGSGQGSYVGYFVINSSGNELRKATSGVATYMEMSTVPSVKVNMAGDLVTLSGGGTVAYWAGAAPAGVFQVPLTV